MFIRLFRIVIAIAIVLWITLFITKDSISKILFFGVGTLTFLEFNFGIHGLIVYSIRPPTTNGELITPPHVMWIFWTILFLIFVFLIIPIYNPGFLMYML